MNHLTLIILAVSLVLLWLIALRKRWLFGHIGREQRGALFNVNGNSTITIDNSATTACNLSAYVTEIDGLVKGYVEIDITAIADTAEKVRLGIVKKLTLRIRGNHDDTATTGPHAVFTGIVGGNTDRTVTIVIDGAKQVSFEALCVSYEPDIQNKGIAMFEAVMVSNGAITFA